MDSDKCPKLQEFVRSEFARGRKANTALRVMSELEYFAKFLECNSLLDVEYATLEALIDSKTGTAYQRCRNTCLQPPGRLSYFS